ncbi:RNase H family protein [Neorickettsia helminthoeca str. Oregon]|uniref:Ribonuclease H n=1 Tax=Neorickettsia helminthoeca str. Oregon TaxID=1286528 RepID=X5H4T0_9RICK|nr:ribonuclease HI [Neorickettsia helminthoeca]AHX11566.1 RNase H family protein [Neorickettsia helminthoeca str. Oregon]
MEKYIIYTDGACSGNPGPGGWAAIIIQEGVGERIISGKEISTTNNQMELIAAIKALESFEEKGQRITLYTDSNYVYKGITSWIQGWMKNRWYNSSKEPVKNKEMWLRLHAVSLLHDIEWFWVKAHNGDYYNEIVDRIARQEAQNAFPELT